MRQRNINDKFSFDDEVMHVAVCETSVISFLPNLNEKIVSSFQPFLSLPPILNN